MIQAFVETVRQDLADTIAGVSDDHVSPEPNVEREQRTDNAASDRDVAFVDNHFLDCVQRSEACVLEVNLRSPSKQSSKTKINNNLIN